MRHRSPGIHVSKRLKGQLVVMLLQFQVLINSFIQQKGSISLAGYC